MANITEEFTDYLFCKADKISDEIKKKAEACYRDYYAVTVAGAKKNKKRWKPVLETSSSGPA